MVHRCVFSTERLPAPIRVYAILLEECQKWNCTKLLLQLKKRDKKKKPSASCITNFGNPVRADRHVFRFWRGCGVSRTVLAVVPIINQLPSNLERILVFTMLKSRNLLAEATR